MSQIGNKIKNSNFQSTKWPTFYVFSPTEALTVTLYDQLLFLVKKYYRATKYKEVPYYCATTKYEEVLYIESKPPLPKALILEMQSEPLSFFSYMYAASNKATFFNLFSESLSPQSSALLYKNRKFPIVVSAHNR